jgi:DNA-binding LytR/AlgR family response regulator
MRPDVRTIGPVTVRALVVDDEQPVLDELVWLLGRDDRIGEIRTARSGAEAIRELEAGDIDLLFLDVAMPGLNGMDIARIVDKFRHPPRIVFVTAHEKHAVDAFDLGAADYVLKPIREERLRESIRRAVADRAEPAIPDDDQVVVELGGVTRFVSRSSIAYVEAAGDYVRLHTVDGATHLIRMPLGTLAKDWAEAGFVRVHRSIAVNLAHVREMRNATGHATVVVTVGEQPVELAVARREARAVRERLHGRAV